MLNEGSGGLRTPTPAKPIEMRCRSEPTCQRPEPSIFASESKQHIAPANNAAIIRIVAIDYARSLVQGSEDLRPSSPRRSLRCPSCGRTAPLRLPSCGSRGKGNQPCTSSQEQMQPNTSTTFATLSFSFELSCACLSPELVKHPISQSIYCDGHGVEWYCWVSTHKIISPLSRWHLMMI